MYGAHQAETYEIKGLGDTRKIKIFIKLRWGPLVHFLV
jgi:hypothetical protein